MMRLRPGAVVVDVGANVGQFAESVIAHQPYAQLHLFEPIPEAFEALRRHLADLGGIHFNNLALGNFNGQRDLVVRRFDEATSFLELGKRLIDGVYGLDFASDRTITAEVRRLTDYVHANDVPAIELL